MKKVGSPLWASYKQYVVEPNNSAQAKSHLSHSSFKIRSRKKDGYSYNMRCFRKIRNYQKRHKFNWNCVNQSLLIFLTITSNPNFSDLKNCRIIHQFLQHIHYSNSSNELLFCNYCINTVIFILLFFTKQKWMFLYM